MACSQQRARCAAAGGRRARSRRRAPRPATSLLPRTALRSRAYSSLLLRPAFFLYACARCRYKIHAQKSCAGISLKTQILYAIIYVARYTDLLNSYISLYNSSMKIIFIASAVRRRRLSARATSRCARAQHAPCRGNAARASCSRDGGAGWLWVGPRVDASAAPTGLRTNREAVRRSLGRVDELAS